MLGTRRKPRRVETLCRLTSNIPQIRISQFFDAVRPVALYSYIRGGFTRVIGSQGLITESQLETRQSTYSKAVYLLVPDLNLYCTRN